MAEATHLFKKTYSGVLWTLLDVFFSKGFPLVIIILLARILGPAEFGLYGILVFFLAIGITLSESGLTSSLIRHHQLYKSDYSTVFYLNFFLNCVIYGLIFLLSPWIADFFEKPILSSLIRVISTTYILSALTAVHLAILNKKMRFKKIAMLNLPGAFIGGILGLVLANHQYGIWSIVYMNVTIQLITSFLIWFNMTWRPGFVYSGLRAAVHFKFGVNMLLSGLLDTIFKNSYNLIIGKFYPMQSLAFFERARSLQEYPTVAITAITNKVSYPLLARQIHTDAANSDSFFRKLIQVTFFINTPFILILAGVALPLFRLILGPEWLDAVPYFQILCLGSVFYPHHAYNLNILKVKGRSDLFLKLEVIKKILMLIIIVISVSYGITGLLWGMVANSVLVLYINIYYSGQYIHYNFLEQLKDLLPPLIIGLGCFLLTNYLCEQFQPLPVYLQIILPAITGMGIYFSLNFFLNQKDSLKYLNLFMKR